jgi:hypothetical protein
MVQRAACDTQHILHLPIACIDPLCLSTHTHTHTHTHTPLPSSKHLLRRRRRCRERPLSNVPSSHPVLHASLSFPIYQALTLCCRTISATNHDPQPSRTMTPNPRKLRQPMTPNPTTKLTLDANPKLPCVVCCVPACEDA